MSPVNKVVLVSSHGYESKHDDLLRRLIEDGVRLFCAVGHDAEVWEEVMDEIFVGDGSERDFELLTSAHPDESVEQVIAFANSIVLDEPGELRVVEV